MDKSTWLLLDDPEKIKQLGQWLDRLLVMDDTKSINTNERIELEKNIFNVFEWIKDYED